jgi:Na+/melibiose symporter-like transporter
MCLQYYLKAQFGYSKDEFANLLLIAGAAGMLSQLTVMPVLARFVGEDILLIIGLLGGCTHVTASFPCIFEPLCNNVSECDCNP